MLLDEKMVVLAASGCALAGIALLFLMGETPRQSSVAEALVSEPNSLLQIQGSAANITAGKFSLCSRLCISVHASGIPAASLLYDGRRATVLGRVKEYQNNRYIEAEKITLQ